MKKIKYAKSAALAFTIVGAFLIGKSTTPEPVMAQVPQPLISAKNYISLSDVVSTIYDASENKITISTSTDSYEFEPDIINSPFEIYDTQDLTEDILTSRQGKLIIEKCIGVVLDNDKNGELVNADPEYNYISYTDVDCKKGDTITSYLFYNPENNYVDDVIFRYDVKAK